MMIENAGTAWFVYLMNYILTPYNVASTSVEDVKAEAIEVIQAAVAAGLALDEIEAVAVEKLSALAVADSVILADIEDQETETAAETFLRTGGGQDLDEYPPQEGEEIYFALGSRKQNVQAEINHISSVNPVAARAEIEALLG